MYNKLVNNGTLDLSEFIHILNKNSVFSGKNITFLIVLTFFNWFFEILKWKTLVASIKEITFFEASQQSLGSLTASLFTPNRIGEYGAKAVYYTKRYRKKIVLLNLLSNVMQMGITIVMGCVGFWLFTSKYTIKIEYFKTSRLFVMALIILIAFLFFFIIKKVHYKIKGVPIEKIKLFVKSLGLKLKGTGLLLSFIRYGIFSFQFYFLLHLFGAPLSYYEAMIVITTHYLLASVVPTIHLFDVVIKGSVAVYLFSFTGINDISVLCIVTLMWLFNFVLPSLFGSYFVLRFNLPKQDVSC